MMDAFLLAVLLLAASVAHAERRSHRSIFGHRSAMRDLSADNNIFQCISQEVERIKGEHCGGVGDKELATLTQTIQDALENLFQDHDNRLFDILKKNNQDLLKQIGSSQKGGDCQSCLAQILPYVEGCHRDLGRIEKEISEQIAGFSAGMAQQAVLVEAATKNFDSFRKTFKASLRAGFDRLHCVAPIVETANRPNGDNEWRLTQPPLKTGASKKKYKG